MRSQDLLEGGQLGLIRSDFLAQLPPEISFMTCLLETHQWVAENWLLPHGAQVLLKVFEIVCHFLIFNFLNSSSLSYVVGSTVAFFARPNWGRPIRLKT